MNERVREYLRHIGVEHIHEPNLNFLRELQSQHLLTVPFENWDIHTGRGIIVDQDTFIDKILHRNRGGFCYELNGAFAWLLEELGFEVARLSARVEMASGSFGPEFDHLTLLVNGAYIADVGYGASSLFTLPLTGEVVTEPLTSYRISTTDNTTFVYQSLKGDQWHSEYLFTLQDHSLDSFDQMCLYHQTAPDSPFTRGTLCTKATPEGRITIRGTILSEISKDGKTEQQITENDRTLLLKQLFNVDILS